MLLDPESGSVTPFLDTAGSEGFRGVNDLTFAGNGDLYFTDQGQTGLQDPTGRVYRLRPSGELTCLIDTVPSPNGIVIDTAMKSLFVAVTRRSRSGASRSAPAGWSRRSGCSRSSMAGWAGRTASRSTRRAA